MNEKLDWTQKLGDAFLADQKAVMTDGADAAQEGADAGNLKSTEQQKVTTETQAGADGHQGRVRRSPKSSTFPPTTRRRSTAPGGIRPTRRTTCTRRATSYAPGLAFATGVVVGAAIWGNCNWGGNDININTNNYNNFNKTNISNGNNKFNHNAENRKGVAYKDQGVAQKYNRGGDQTAAQSREQFRGRAEQGRRSSAAWTRASSRARRAIARRRSARRRRGGGAAGANTRDMGSRGSAAGGGSGSRDFGGGGSGASSRGGGSGGFSGSHSGASTRAASSRGSTSRGGGGGGRGGGGRR